MYPESFILEKAVVEGLMVGSAVPNTIRVAPPLTITEDEIDFGIDVLNKVLSEVDEMCD
jgi:4-aminobutyrate aminotransferase-like enzyme